MGEVDELPAAWRYGPESRPERSLLAGLEPIGIGTPLAEDIASFFVRLSWRHTRAPARLVRDVLAPAFADASGAGDAADWQDEFERVTRHPVGSLVGHAPVAATWADALGLATGQPDLRSLTLVQWADVLPRKHLLRAHRAWCPRCLEEKRLEGVPVYAPLIWQIAEVTACVRHEVRLTTTCSCGMSSGVLASWTRMGFCPCGAWLGSQSVRDGDPVGGDDLDWQRYVFAQVGSLIATTPRLPGPVASVGTAEAVKVCWERSGLSLRRLAGALGMAVSTLSLWKDGRRQPTLPGALRLCRVAAVDLVAFLRSDLDALRLAPRPEGERPYVRPSDEAHRKIDWVAARRELVTAMSADPPESLAGALRRLGIQKREAKRECATECAAIATRHRSFVEARAKGARELSSELVRTAIADLHKEGMSASRQQVQRRLPSWVSLRRPELKAIWREANRGDVGQCW